MQATGGAEPDEISKLYDLDTYGAEEGLHLTGACMEGLTCYTHPKEDPYVTLDNLSDTSSQDYTINQSDNLLLVGRADEEYSVVEVHVYNDTSLDLFCHHEIMLNAYPLAIELVRLEGLSLVAVATMEPCIELWDLDLVDAVEPCIILGKLKKKKKKKKESKVSVKKHTNSVLCLSWNKNTPHLLASGSADHTVRVWDLSTHKCVETLPHPDTVQSVSWNPYNPSLLLSGCVDGSVRVYDCAREDKLILSASLSSEVEKVVWDHFSPSHILACTENGRVFCISAESGDILLQISAHDGAVTDIALSTFLPGLLVSTSVDKSYKVWELSPGEAKCLHSVSPGAGKLYCAGFSPDSPYVFAVGGEKHGLRVVDLMSIAPVRGMIKGKELKRLVS